MILCFFQIAEKLELLLTEREGLYATWEDHKTELDQAYDLHVFLRDAKQIDTLTSTQEVKPTVQFLSLSEGGGGAVKDFSLSCVILGMTGDYHKNNI